MNDRLFEESGDPETAKELLNFLDETRKERWVQLQHPAWTSSSLIFQFLQSLQSIQILLLPESSICLRLIKTNNSQQRSKKGTDASTDGVYPEFFKQSGLKVKSWLASFFKTQPQAIFKMYKIC